MSRLLNIIVEHETPILEAHGLSMWEYVILTRLASHDGMTQKQLASSSRRDPTRLGSNLDALSGRALIDREVDHGDRRRRLVRITKAGYKLLNQVRSDITAMEQAVMGDASTHLRSALETALRQAGHAYQDGPRQ